MNSIAMCIAATGAGQLRDEASDEHDRARFVFRTERVAALMKERSPLRISIVVLRDGYVPKVGRDTPIA